MKKFLVLLIFAFAFQAQAQIDPSFGGLKQYKSQSSKADETRNTAGLNLDNFSTLNWKSDERFKVITTNGQGLPLSLEGKVDQGRSSSWESKAQIWLEATAEVMLQDERTEFVKEKLWTDALGQTHLKMDQYHEGVKVFDGEIILHAEGDAFTLQNGHYAPSASLPHRKNKTLAETEIKHIIGEDLENFQPDWIKTTTFDLDKDVHQWEGELVYYRKKGQYRLAYNYIVRPNLAERFEYLVDAETGEVLDHWSTVCQLHSHDHKHNGNCTHGHNKENNPPSPPPPGPEVANATDLLGVNRRINTFEDGGNFFLIDASRSSYRPSVSNIPDEPIGAIWTIDIGGQSPINSGATFEQIVSGNNVWNNSREGVSAHYNAGEAFQYFEDVHNRNGITGDGQTIVSIVNVSDEDGSSLGNAFYNSLAIWYGNGDNTFFPLGRALDVAGHELSHGVVENTANLIYQNESGAMNESFADIFGAMIDRDDWLIGEDVVRPGVFAGGALRNLQDPHNGAANQDFGRGWQPRHYSERFTGPQDNGGVHINSGIPNHAYYRFAIQVGKERAEQVFYRALTTYLTRSSMFTDLRFSVERAAADLYDQTVVNAASQAFADVGIGQATEPDYENDISVNSGSDLLLFSDVDKDNLFVANLNTGEFIFNPLSTTPQFSKPSVTDDGSQIIFVGKDNYVHLINIDWSTNPPQREEFVLDQLFGGNWYSTVISKDGNRVALIENADVNEIVVYDDILRESRTFTLFNPSFSDGVETGEVVFSDAMEFDHSGNILMYDALNRIENSINTNPIEYWDIGFLQVWNGQNDTWASGSIEKLFGSLPENVSIGNATFSKNSPHIIAFDVRTENQGNFEFSVSGMNIESNRRETIVNNNTFSFPNFSRDDRIMVVDFSDGSGPPSFPFVTGIANLELNEDKITGVPNSADVLIDNMSWGVWFTNGSRALPTSTEDIVEEDNSLQVFPVPAQDILFVTLDSPSDEKYLLELRDVNGKAILNEALENHDLNGHRIDVSGLIPGLYLITINSDSGQVSKKFVKE